MMVSWEQIAVFCLISAILALVLRQYRPEFSMLISMACGIAALLFLLEGIGETRQELDRMLAATMLPSERLTVVFKGLGICVLGEFAGQLCRDAGESAIALKVELAGRTALLLLALPLFYQLLQTVSQLLSAVG